MKESEKAEKNVDARRIIDEVLKAVGMNAPTFANKIGINYQRIFDLQRGRTKKFNPGVVNLICEAFPQINKTYLFTGEGSVLNNTNEQPQITHNDVPLSGMSEIIAMSHKVIELFKQVTDKDDEVQARSRTLDERERELIDREIAIIKREAEVEKKEIALGIKKVL